MNAGSPMVCQIPDCTTTQAEIEAELKSFLAAYCSICKKDRGGKLCGCAFPCSLTFRSQMLLKIHELLQMDKPPKRKTIQVCFKHPDLLKQAREACVARRDEGHAHRSHRSTGPDPVDVRRRLPQETSIYAPDDTSIVNPGPNTLVMASVYGRHRPEGPDSDSSQNVVIHFNESDIVDDVSGTPLTQVQDTTESSLMDSPSILLAPPATEAQPQQMFDTSVPDETLAPEAMATSTMVGEDEANLPQTDGEHCMNPSQNGGAPDHLAPPSAPEIDEATADDAQAVAELPPPENPVTMRPESEFEDEDNTFSDEDDEDLDSTSDEYESSVDELEDDLMLNIDHSKFKDSSKQFKIQYVDYNDRVLNREMKDMVYRQHLHDLHISCQDGTLTSNSLLIGSMSKFMHKVLHDAPWFDHRRMLIMPDVKRKDLAVLISLLFNPDKVINIPLRKMKRVERIAKSLCIDNFSTNLDDFVAVERPSTPPLAHVLSPPEAIPSPEALLQQSSLVPAPKSPKKRGRPKKDRSLSVVKKPSKPLKPLKPLKPKLGRPRGRPRKRAYSEEQPEVAPEEEPAPKMSLPTPLDEPVPLVPPQEIMDTSPKESQPLKPVPTVESNPNVSPSQVDETIPQTQTSEAGAEEAITPAITNPAQILETASEPPPIEDTPPPIEDTLPPIEDTPEIPSFDKAPDTSEPLPTVKAPSAKRVRSAAKAKDKPKRQARSASPVKATTPRPGVALNPTPKAVLALKTKPGRSKATTPRKPGPRSRTTRRSTSNEVPESDGSLTTPLTRSLRSAQSTKEDEEEEEQDFPHVDLSTPPPLTPSPTFGKSSRRKSEAPKKIERWDVNEMQNLLANPLEEEEADSHDDSEPAPVVPNSNRGTVEAVMSEPEADRTSSWKSKSRTSSVQVEDNTPVQSPRPARSKPRPKSRQVAFKIMDGHESDVSQASDLCELSVKLRAFDNKAFRPRKKNQ